MQVEYNHLKGSRKKIINKIFILIKIFRWTNYDEATIFSEPAFSRFIAFQRVQ